MVMNGNGWDKVLENGGLAVGDEIKIYGEVGLVSGQ